MSLLIRMVLVLICGLGLLQGSELKVGVFHPLLVDLAKQVGGDGVEVINLAQGAADLHRFQPGMRELSQARGADLYLVAGKGFEPYLGKLQSIVGKDRVVEVGAKIPSLTYGEGVELHACCADDADHEGHEHGEDHDVGHQHAGVDPHWWQSTDAWRRAASIVAGEFGRRDPANQALYMANARVFRTRMDVLNTWAEGQLRRVPKKQRILVTAHAAFGYFCRDYGWKMLPVQGMNREQSPSPQWLGEMAAVIERAQIGAVFPEKTHNPKVLQSLVKQTGVKVGRPLIADGTGTIEEMFRHNVGAIVEVLGQ